MARSKQLTQAAADAATPRRSEYALADDRVPGLSLRVRTSGVKAWVVRRTFDGRPRRITLGSADEMTLDEARRRAGLETGVVTPARRNSEREIGARLTLGEVATAYLSDREGPTGERMLTAARCYLRSQLLPRFGAMPIDEITPPAVAHWFMGYSRTSPGGANTAIALIRTLVIYAREHGLARRDLSDPTGPIPRNKRPPRGRLLSSHQLEELGRTLADWPNQTVADAIRLILLTGCRSGEIIRLKWSEVEHDRLTLAHTKTGPREVLLSDQALALLRRRRRKRLGNAVFPHPKAPNASIETIPDLWRRLRTVAGLPDDIRLHDLRHSYASHSIMNGETLHMTGKLLGHAQVASTGRYAHLDGDFTAAAAERVSTEVDRMMRGL